ncbi:hypothetical protein BST83_15040 [Polaribacter filamentus]|jgi:hypothetical protein|uniref:Uncharacterized protein n=1 Tax=Polaribacter filamentus TaxID=53483 RepID=A0A2S7L051_9FLAO|nr:hypothetical protein [Polaribacter filamentus]PQB08295.1 hypothetical protein BST83_15040 [Polaribacter filamentus]
MKLFKQIYWLINPLLIVVFMLITENFFEIDEIVISTSIAVILAYILSPRVKVVEKQHGAEEQIKWLLFKKVFINKI